MPNFGGTSISRLMTCHGDIVKLMAKAIQDSPIDFTVVCGFRNQEDQDKAFAQGYSKVKWPNGKHNKNPSLAVDIAPVVDGKVVWDDEQLFAILADHILKVAKDIEIKISWGGNWTHFVDRPHYEIEGA